MGNGVIEVTAETWQEEVLGAGVPVLVDFWADWCGPCRGVGLILEDVAEDMGDLLKIVKVDVGSNQKLADDYQVRSLPTLLLIRGGVVQEQIGGTMSRDAISRKLEEYVV